MVGAPPSPRGKLMKDDLHGREEGEGDEETKAKQQTGAVH